MPQPVHPLSQSLADDVSTSARSVPPPLATDKHRVCRDSTQCLLCVKKGTASLEQTASGNVRRGNDWKGVVESAVGLPVLCSMGACVGLGSCWPF